MVPRYTAKIPYLGSAIRRQQAEYARSTSKSFNFADAFWTPPLAPRQAYRLEEKQVQRQFRLPALVSLTDHDDIRAASMLRVMERFRQTPISNEWTIPYRGAFFHLGVHNLPAAESSVLFEAMSRFTANPQEHQLGPLLDMLSSLPDVLLILNHPLWDEEGIGHAQHVGALNMLLNTHRHRLHGLELNGLRSWDENKQVIALGGEVNLPVVSGGDRHGREPNAILNLSHANTFAGFVREVRNERRSHVVFMPQYHEPLKSRILQTMVDVVRHYPENLEGRRLWSDRVFYRDPETSVTVPISAVWTDGGPRVIGHFLAAMRLLEWRGIRTALKLALNDRAAV